MKRIFFVFTCLLILGLGLGCGREVVINEKEIDLDVEGKIYENKKHGFFIKLYPEYERVDAGEKSATEHAVCYAHGKITRFATIFWTREVSSVHNEYKRAFENPQNFQDASALLILEDLGVLGKIIEVKKLDIKDVDAYYFQTKHRRMLTEFYRTRIEAFPKYRDVQITIFFQNLKEDLPKVAKMIESMKIDPGIKSVEKEISCPFHHH